MTTVIGLGLGLSLSACAEEAPILGSPGAPKAPQAAVAAEQASGEQHEEAPSEPTEYSVRGELGLIKTLSGGLERERGRASEPFCEPEGVDVAVEDGAGEIIALATVAPVDPTRVEREPGYVMWECEHTYTATFPADSAVYNFRAYFAGLENEYEQDERLLSADQVREGTAPFLMLNFCPSCNY